MRSLITSYLLQSKECILPGIGILKIIHTPASTDANNNRILPPFEGIIFKKENHSKSPGLVKYIADKENIEVNEAQDQLYNFCNEWKEKINAGERLDLETVGSIQKNADGLISFERSSNFNFLLPVPVKNNFIAIEKPLATDKILRFQEAKELKAESKELKEDIIVERSYWGLWALILLAIGFVLIFYHFINHGLPGSGIGNQSTITVDSAAATYITPK